LSNKERKKARILTLKDFYEITDEMANWDYEDDVLIDEGLI